MVAIASALNPWRIKALPRYIPNRVHIDNCLIVKELAPRERSPGLPATPQRSRTTGVGLHDNRFARYGREVLSQTHDTWVYLVRRPEIEHQDVIVVMVNDFVQSCKEFGMPAAAQAALENRELQPLPVAFHQPEYGTPPFLVTDVVAHNIQVLIHESTSS
jgi:hypothetical protein